jgi:nucleotide-binding universal stress UspA family protein
MAATILVPVDGSPLSKRAFERALETATDRVLAVHVVDPSDPGYSTPADVDVRTEPLHGSPEWYERAEEAASDLFEELLDVASAYDVEVETLTVTGEPVREIVDLAERRDVDEIVVGGHGREGETGILLGRVAELVVARSSTTVTVVR